MKERNESLGGMKEGIIVLTRSSFARREIERKKFLLNITFPVEPR